MILQHRIIIRQVALSDYANTFSTMSQFTRNRDENTPDEIWCLQHQPIFTLGMAGKEEHILDSGSIPIIKTDRGGQVTYHGPGQLVVYLLLDLQRKGITVKRYVDLLEQSLIDMCASLGIDAERKAGAPGVYVAGKKIAALGIRVKRGCSYHGLALNVDMDLSPFRQINPCGYPGLQVTQLKDEGSEIDNVKAFIILLPYLMKHLDYSEVVTDQSDTQLLKPSRAA